MHKSSIYLPDELKQALVQRAAAAGRSEADLIRLAITRLLAAAGNDVTGGPGSEWDSGRGGSGTGAARAPKVDPATQVELPRPGLIGVGVGPGDPGLVTVRAVATLRAADRVVVISTDARSIGRAEAVVRAVAPLAAVQRVAFDLDRAKRAASMRQLVRAVIAGVDVGEAVAVAVLGDPTQWTVFPDLATVVSDQRPSLPIEAVPGITSWQAAASSGVLRLGSGDQTLVVTADIDRARRAALDGDAVVLHKAATDGEAVRELVAASARPDAVVAHFSGLPGAHQVPATEVPDGPLAYLSALIAPAPPPDTPNPKTPARGHSNAPHSIASRAGRARR